MSQKVDGGYGWVIVASSFLLSIMLIAPLASFGVFYNDLMYAFSTSNTLVSWIASIHTGLAGFGGIASGPLVKAYGARRTCIAGTACSVVGFLASTFSPNVYVLFLTFGVISGVGTCILTTATTVIVNEYFDKKRAMATAMLMSGISTGIFIWPAFARFLTNQYGWRGALALHGAIVANGFPLSGLLRPFKRKVESDSTADQSDERGQNRCRELTSICRLIYKHPLLLVMGFSSFAENVAFMVNAFFVVPRATSIGIDPQRAAFLLSVKGVGSFFGRVFVVLFGDRKVCSRVFMYGSAVAVFGVVTISVSFWESYPLLAVTLALCGFCPGLATSLSAPVLVDIISIEELPLTYGYVMACFGASSILSPLLAGIMGDLTGGYGLPFITHGSVTILGGLSVLLIPLVRRCSKSAILVDVKRTTEATPCDEYDKQENVTML